jgi:hypothetical protein
MDDAKSMANNSNAILPGRFLLPHERAFASWFVRFRSNPKFTTTKYNRNYGPEGLALMGAAAATWLPGLIIGWAGLAMIVVSIIYRPFDQVVAILLGTGAALIALSLIRVAQASLAGRNYRGDRPLESGPFSH